MFTEPYINAIKAGLVVGGVALIPTFYYPGLHIDWLAKATDGALFYFRNDKEGQAQCGEPSAANGGLCTAPQEGSGASFGVGIAGQPLANVAGFKGAPSGTIPCTSCCLCGGRAERSLKNLASEIDDFVSALPAGHPLHIGVYSYFSHCVPPSATYTREMLERVLGNPAVSGATVYTTQVPKTKCLPPDELVNETDKGCIVRSIFANYSACKE